MGRCTILVVSHGDTLQILQTILNVANQHKDSTDVELESRLEAVQVAPVLSQHRKYALLTGELREVIWNFASQKKDNLIFHFLVYYEHIFQELEWTFVDIIYDNLSVKNVCNSHSNCYLNQKCYAIGGS